MISISSVNKSIYFLGNNINKEEKFEIYNSSKEEKVNEAKENKNYLSPNQLYNKERSSVNLADYNPNYNRYDIYNEDYKYSVYSSFAICNGSKFTCGINDIYFDLEKIEEIMPIKEFENLVTEYINIMKQDKFFSEGYPVEFIVDVAENLALSEISGTAFRTNHGFFTQGVNGNWYKDLKIELPKEFSELLSEIAKYISENYTKNLVFDYWDKFLDEIDKMPSDSDFKKAFNHFNKNFY